MQKDILIQNWRYLAPFYYQLLLLMSTGTVKFFNESKGYGFIVDADSKKEYFVHISGLVDQVKEGDRVQFELKEGKKGLNAIGVKAI